jgi:drug/metabolite transporter (DMT)-like permease
LAAQLGFGLFPVAGKLLFDATGQHGVPPLGVAALRAIFGATTLMAFARLAGAPPVEDRADLRRLAVYSLFGIVANQLLFLQGLAFSSATHAGVLVAASPAIAYALAIALKRELLRAQPAVGVAIAMAGAAWIVLLRPADPSKAGPRPLLGDVLLITNVTSYAIYLVLVRSVLQRVDPLRATAWVLTFGAIVNVPVGFPSLLRVEWSGLGPQQWGALAFVLLFPTSICYALNSYALRRASATLAAVYTCTQPIVASVSAALVLGETLRPETAFAGLLILLGVGLVAFRARA